MTQEQANAVTSSSTLFLLSTLVLATRRQPSVPLETNRPGVEATLVYRIAGKFRGVKNSFNLRNGGFREQKFHLVSLPALHSYVPVSYAYVNILCRSACPRK